MPGRERPRGDFRFDIVTIRSCVGRSGSAPNLGSIRQIHPHAPAPDRPLVPATGGGQTPQRDHVRREKILRPRASGLFRRRRGGRGPAGHQEHEPGPPPRGGQSRAIPPRTSSHAGAGSAPAGGRQPAGRPSLGRAATLPSAHGRWRGAGTAAAAGATIAAAEESAGGGWGNESLSGRLGSRLWGRDSGADDGAEPGGERGQTASRAPESVGSRAA